MSFLERKITISLTRKAQMPLLLVKKVTFLAKFSNFADVFLVESANVLLEQFGVNEHAIELKKQKQPPYRPIYSLWPVELKTLKIYIKINLANGFIKALKPPTNAPTLFVHKVYGSLCLYVNY